MRRFCFTALLIVFVNIAFAQSGKITGKVINANSGIALASATLTLTEKSLTIAADQNGVFVFGKLTPGIYSIRCTYGGYHEKIIDSIVVKDNDNTSITISLDEKNLGEVVVKTTRAKASGETNAALLIAQKNSPNVSDFITAESIRKTPDRSTSDVLKRVSGASIQDDRFAIIRGLNDRYNAAFINGAPLPSTESDRKAFAFDIFPSAILDNLVIYKTATADKSGEFAGGLIDITTKSTLPKNFTSISIAGSYNTMLTGETRYFSENKGEKDWIGKDDGVRAIPSGIPNTTDLRTSTSSQKAEYAKLFSDYKWGVKRRTTKPDYNIQISKGFNIQRNDKEFIGVLLSFNYKEAFTFFDGERNARSPRGEFKDSIYNDEIVMAFLGNISIKIDNRNNISWKNNLSINTDNRLIKRSGVPDLDSDPNTVTRDIVRAFTSNQIFSSQLAGEHQVGKKRTKINWLGAYADVEREVPNFSRTSYYGTATSLGSAFFNNTPSQLFGSGTMFFANTKEDIKSFKAEVMQPYTFMKNSQNSFKVGGGYQVRKRNFISRLLGFAPYSNGSVQFDNTLLELPEDQIFLPEHLGVMKNGKGGFLLNDGTTPNPDYDAESSTISAFIMNDQRFGKKFRFIYGVRMERFNQKLNSPSGFASIPALTLDSVVTDFLPSGNLVYALTGKMNLRLSYSQTVNRPEFRELAPFVFYDYQSQYSVSGDIRLRRAKISNYDFRYEFYPGKAQLFSVSAFYKKFDNPIEIIFVPGIAGQASYSNSVSAEIYGVEAEFRTLASTIFGIQNEESFLSKLTLSANAAYIKSKVILPFVAGTGNISRIDADRPMQGQSPYLINGSISYNDDKSGFSSTLSMNKIGDRLSVAGVKDEVPDIYEKARTVVDFQLAKFFAKNVIEIKLTARDILAQDFVFYFDNDKSKSLTDNDIYFSKYKVPKVFTFSLTYKF